MTILRTAFNFALSRRASFRKDCSGFTLLEVMISVSIISLVFVSLFRMQSGTIALAEAGRFNTLVPTLASQLLVKIEKDPDGWNQDQGDFGERYPGYSWSCDISDAPLEDVDFIHEDQKKRFRKIKIRIMDEQDKRSYGITTWRYVVE